MARTDAAINAKVNKKKLRVSTVILYIVLIAGTLICLVPLYWMLRSSLMSNAEIFVFPPRFFPSTWRWNNYVKTFQNFEAVMYFPIPSRFWFPA